METAKRVAFLRQFLHCYYKKGATILRLVERLRINRKSYNNHISLFVLYKPDNKRFASVYHSNLKFFCNLQYLVRL